MDVTIDIETYYDSEYSLKKMTMTEYIRHPKFKLQSLAIKVEDQETQYYDTENIPQAIDFISNLPRPWTFVGQNTAFDAAALNWHYGVRPDMYADTMSMSRAYWPGESASLDALGKRLFPNDPSLHKIHGTLESFLGVETLTPEQHERMAIYNKRDVDLTYRVYKTLLSFGFPEEELYQVHMIIRMYAEPMFVTDAPLLREAIHDDVTETENAIERALEAVRLRGVPDTFDLPLDVKLFSSNPRYARLLSEVFGLKPPMKTNTKGAATYAFGKKDVPYIRFKDDNPELEPIFIARELAKSTISATRAQTLLNCSNDGALPLPVPLKYYGAATGRYSGSDGINLQNLPRGSRHRLALCAPGGYQVYVADSSNIEARTNACFAGQNDLVEAFRHGFDVYSNFAEEVVYHYPVSKATKTERNVGKTCILGLGYGMGVLRFQQTLQSGPMGAPPMECSLELAQTCVYGYRRKYPEIARSWQVAQQMLLAMMDPRIDLQWGPLRVIHNGLLLPNGLFLSYPGLRFNDLNELEYWNGKFWKKIYGANLIENICQCLAGIVIKQAMNNIDRWLVENNLGCIVLQVHDEIIVIAKDNDSRYTPDDIQAKIQEFMCVSPVWMPNLPLDSEGGYAKNYSK